MRKYIIILLALSLTTVSLIAKDSDKDKAKKSKAEKKRLKQEIRKMLKDPESYGRMKSKLSTEEALVTHAKDTVAQMSSQVSDLQNKVTNLEGQLKECQDKPAVEAAAPKPCPEPGAIPTEGTVYKIQTGLYNAFSVSYLDTPKYFGAERAGDGTHYVISYFTDKAEAEKFASQIRTLGIRGAFVAKYENGQRVYEKK